MKKILTDILTEDDNQTFCIARLCTLLCVIAFIAIGFIHAFRGVTFDFSQFGIGFGSVLGGSGILIGGKAATQQGQ